MIDFRYHLVSIVAVFLALAIGIVLGSTELQGPTYNLLDRTTAKLQAELGQVSGRAQHGPGRRPRWTRLTRRRSSPWCCTTCSRASGC